MDMHLWSLDWSDDLSIGMPELDRQHQQLVALIKDMNLAIVDRMELAEVRGRLQRLFDYAMEEFSSEDTLLRQLDYPHAEQHAREHKGIIEDFNEIMDALDENAPMYPWVEAGLKLKTRLIDHFLSEVMQFREHPLSLPC